MQASARFTFEAAHHLDGHPKCGRLHGHSYKLEVTVNTVASIPISSDFGVLKAVVRRVIIDKFDHQDLNAFLEYPSAERLTVVMANSLRKPLQAAQMNLVSVALNETADCKVTYWVTKA